MVQAAVEGAIDGASGASAAPGGCGILGVTILTSMDADGVGAVWGREGVDVTDEVVRLATLVRRGGGSGIVCSGHEAAAVQSAFGDALGLLIPGIRLPGGNAHDQRRVMTPAAAAAAGARWLILGRAVTEAADPVAAMELVAASLAGLA